MWNLSYKTNKKQKQKKHLLRFVLFSEFFTSGYFNLKFLLAGAARAGLGIAFGLRVF